MKRVVVRPAARADRRRHVRYYREQAGQVTAGQLVDRIEASIGLISRQPAIGDPRMGQRLGVDLRVWRITGFPLVWVYLEQAEHVDFIRLISYRQDVSLLFDSFFTEEE